MKLSEANLKLNELSGIPFNKLFTNTQIEDIIKNKGKTGQLLELALGNGTHIQVRSKDSKPYHPIFSSVYNREISNKNHAFYFQKQFVSDIQKMNERG